MEENMSIMSVVNLMPSNNNQLAIFKSGIKDAIVNGEVNPLQALKQLKMIEKVLDVLKDEEVEKVILSEASKYHKQELSELNGCKYEIREVGTKYDYSNCGDEDLYALEDELKKIQEGIKARQDFLKTLPKDTDTYGSNGVSLNRPAKSSTTKVVVTIL